MDIKSAFGDYILQGVSKAKELSHEEFVKQLNDERIKFELVTSNKYRLLSKSHSIRFSVYASMYVVAPLLTFTVLSVIDSNWTLMIGAVASYLGSFLAGRGSKLPFIITMAILGYWTVTGFRFYNLHTMAFICMWWGFTWYKIADTAEDLYSRDAVIKKPQLYYTLAGNGSILIIENPNK